jgi:PAS domain S-box-containing protein
MGGGRVAGLTVEQRPEWTNVRLGDNYFLTLRVIDGNMVHVAPSGHATASAVGRAVTLVDEAVREGVGTGTPYVHIGDYSKLEGATQEARRTFTEFMKDRPNLVGVVFCGASPLFRLSIQIAARLHVLRDRTVIVDSFEEAVDRARELLRRVGAEGTDAPVHDDDEAWPRQGPEGTVRLPEWQVDLDGFSLQWEVVDGHIAHGVARGILGSQHVEPLFEKNRRVAEFITQTGAPVSAVVDIAQLGGITVNGRRSYVRAFRELQESNPIRLLVFYGANHLLRGALAIWRPLLPLPVVTTRDLDSALRIVRRRRPKRRTLAERLGLAGGLRRSRRALSAQGHINELLKFLGTIDWGQSGVERDQVADFSGSPLAPVYDAVVLLKSELDQQLSERRAAEEALRESEERYRTILDTIVDGYYEIDFDGNVTFCNDAMLRILGYEPDELPNLTNQAYMTPDYAKRVESVFRQVYETGQPATSLDWELIGKDGQGIAVEASISLIRGGNGDPAGFRGIIRDVTERVQVAREREQLEAQLRHAQRMEAVGTLAGGIAHNFNNLLMGIQGNVSLMRKQTDPRHPHNQRLRVIESLVQSGSTMTAQLLGYARVGNYEVRPLDLDQLTHQTAETFALARREIRVHEDFTAGLPPVRVDGGQIEQALLNLFVNAAEAMPSGGDLFLSSYVTTHEALRGKSYEPKPGTYVCLEIRDTGIGMDEETRERIFEPFFTTKGLSGGTGLGLASVYGTIKAHGGYIEVISTVGAGATFSIYLPATREDVDPTLDTGKIMLGKGTILVVDDDEAVLEACASILEYLKYTPLRAPTGEEAVELYRERAGEIDLVILDMILPDMGGGDVFDAVKEIDPRAKVLLASGYSLEGQAERIIKRGCDDFIQKPFTIEQLSQKIRELIGNG